MTQSDFNTEQVLQFDRNHIWHPYTSMTDPLQVYPVASAKGVEIELMDGRTLVDGMSSWWSAIHGYNHPVLNQAVHDQTARCAHVMFGGLTHEPAVALSKRLIDITPAGLDKVFLADSGSVSVEVAMKMALQFFYSTKQPRKNRFITIKSGYHGDTFHAMSVCDPVTGMHQIYSDVLPQYFFANRPEVQFHQEWDEQDILSLKLLIEKNHKTICALILEPIVQGAGGMRFYHPQYLRRARELCDQYDILLIADEIATGLGRSGKLFASEHADVSPDILCLGKTLTGGYMTLAATLCNDKIAEGLSSGEPGVFMHGPTYMGNPLACHVARTSIDLLLESDWQIAIKGIEEHFKRSLDQCRELDWVLDVRVLGGIGVVELDRPVNMKAITEKFVQKGVWIGPFGNLVYMMPPYCISSRQLTLLTDAVYEILKEEGGW